jgi:hypothetical protein
MSNSLPMRDSGRAFCGPFVLEKNHEQRSLKHLFRDSHRVVVTVVTAMTLAGCSHRTSVPKLSFNASKAADAALVEYDANHDGALAGDELAACPGIKDSLPNFDKNGDGRVDADEMKSRFQVWLDSPTRLLKLLCVVRLDGQPLSGATVTFTPEKFMADALLPGDGGTGANGMAGISIETEDVDGGPSQPTGMRLGLYRVAVTHPSIKIPAKYNSESTLGVEVSPASAGGPVILSLSSR